MEGLVFKTVNDRLTLHRYISLSIYMNKSARIHNYSSYVNKKRMKCLDFIKLYKTFIKLNMVEK